MITFPKWVNGKRGDSERERAARRLRYLVMRAAVEKTEQCTITSFADFVGVERGAVHWSIRTGSFSVPNATRIEEACGADLMAKSWLIFPLDIASE